MISESELQSLHESEVRLKIVQKLGKIGDWQYEVESGKITWSEETYELYGRDAALGTPSPEEESRYYSTEQNKQLRDYAARAIQNGEGFEYDLEANIPGKGKVFFHSTMQPMRDPAGKIYKLIGTVQDITERKRAEHLLIIQKDLVTAIGEETSLNKALEASLDAALKISGLESGGIYLVDETTGCLDLAVHKGVSEAFIKEVRHFDASVPNVRIVMEGKAVYASYQKMPFVTSDAEKKEGLKAIAVVPIKHGEKVIGDINLATRKLNEIPLISRTAIESIAADIGGIISRLRIEKELQLKAQMLDNSTDSIFLHDTEGNFIYVNERAYKDRGYTLDEFMKINLHSLDMPDYAKLIEPRIADLMRTGEAKFESAHLRKDGSVMPVEVHVQLIRVDGRDLILSAARDIAERKKAEEDLKKKVVELERFYKVMAGREDRILELKKEIKELKAGQEKT